MSIPPVAAPAVRAAAPSTAHRVAGWIWSIFLVLVSLLFVISAGGTFAKSTGGLPGGWHSYAFAATFVMMAVAVLLIWRHRFPVAVAAIAIGLTLVMPTTMLVALVALAAVVAARAGWVRWVFIGAAWLACCVTMWLDLSMADGLMSGMLGENPDAPGARTALAWAVPALAAVCVLPFALFGITRRIIGERDAARRGTAAATRNVDVLHREVELARDRHELAREIHDTVAAKLSAVSLQVGALELMTESHDARVAQAARAARVASQGALDDLRGVVHVLRNPEVAAPRAGLGDLSALVDEAAASGTDVRPQVFVSDPGSCDPQISHTLYRLAQESISNVRRHAPGAAMRLDVRGGPEAGITMYAVNWLRPGVAPTSVGGRNGLAGMNERVALVGGTFQAGTTPDGTFVVHAWLPWRAPVV